MHMHICTCSFALIFGLALECIWGDWCILILFAPPAQGPDVLNVANYCSLNLILVDLRISAIIWWRRRTTIATCSPPRMSTLLSTSNHARALPLKASREKRFLDSVKLGPNQRLLGALTQCGNWCVYLHTLLKAYPQGSVAYLQQCYASFINGCYRSRNLLCHTTATQPCQPVCPSLDECLPCGCAGRAGATPILSCIAACGLGH